MKTRKITILSTAVIAMALGTCLLLAANAMAAAEKPKLNATDTQFIQDEAATGTAMVNVFRLGQKKAQSEEVKTFAEALVADHTKANTELATLAASKGVKLSSEPAAKNKDMQDHLQLERTNDADFDKEFLFLIVSSHEKCVKNYVEASTNGEDKDVKDWASKRLPSLQAHLTKAEELSSGFRANEGVTPMKAPDAEPDNTARNMRDRYLETVTPLDQSNTKVDIDTTAQIRKEILDVEGISVNAQNVKIITNKGHVTLRGPVNSEDEKRIIGEIATRIATAEHTDNQLEVRSANTAN